MIEFDRRTAIAAAAGGIIVGSLHAFAAPGRVLKASISLEGNRVLIAVGMNGQGPFIFMIDTGTYVSIVRPDLAKKLKLPIQGYEVSHGIGGKGDRFALYLARDFIIGGAIRQSSVVLEDSFRFGYQQDIYGALAAGILTASDTDLDFDAGELRIYPDGRGDRAGYVAVDAEIPRADRPDRGSRKIVATILVNGQPVRCALDTGSPNTLSLHQSAARRLGLWDDRPFAPSRPNGIGGAGPIARIVRVDQVALGDVRLDRPLISLLGNDLGSSLDGIVGLSFIRLFNMSIDSRGRRLWIKPSRQVSPPNRYGPSGLWLDRAGSRIVVASVGNGSPAAKAGIQPGDRVVGEWNDVLRRINAAVGSSVALKIERGGHALDVAFTLSDFL
jgi:serine protease Do